MSWVAGAVVLGVAQGQVLGAGRGEPPAQFAGAGDEAEGDALVEQHQEGRGSGPGPPDEHDLGQPSQWDGEQHVVVLGDQQTAVFFFDARAGFGYV